VTDRDRPGRREAAGCHCPAWISIRRPARLSVINVYATRLTRRKTSNRITAPMKVALPTAVGIAAGPVSVRLTVQALQ